MDDVFPPRQTPPVAPDWPPSQPQRRPDPGSPRAALIGGLLAAALILAVAVIQQTGWSAVKAAGQPAPTVGIDPTSPVLFEVFGRIYVKLTGAAAGSGPGLADAALPEMDAMADRPELRIRTAIVAAELGKPEDAVARLEAVLADLPGDSPLVADAQDLARLYEPPADGQPSGALDRVSIDRLVTHHAWFGEVASVYGVPASDPAREAVTGGGGPLVMFLGLFGLVILLAVLTGLLLLIFGLVMYARGTLRTRFIPPGPGGSVAIETVAVFAAGFITLKIVAEIVASQMSSAGSALTFTLAAQWALVLTMFWPMVRGVRRRDTLGMLGLHRGQGVLKEIGCGIAGYLACLPLFLLGVLVSVVLLTLWAMIQELMGGQKPPPPDNSIVDVVGRQGQPGVIVLLFLLAAVWAPLVEETIFRGALYRHLRSRWRWLASGIVTALAFGVMHGYALPLLFPVIGLGFGFGILREWRGSTIACMTAHSIHNAGALTLMVVTMRLLGM
jgi:membrane protease YdiL (CAAX protease family)